MTALEICESVLGEMMQAVKDQQAERGITASGKSAESLKVNMGQDGGDLVGDSYFYYQIHGRGPGKMPPMSTILEWIEAKHIEPVDISKESLAFLIARKIGRFGTSIYQGVRRGLTLDVIVAEGTNKAVELLKQNVVSDIVSIFRTLNTSTK